MIEKMTFLSITGPKPDFDRVVETYLSKYEMHLENAMTEMKNASLEMEQTVLRGEDVLVVMRLQLAAINPQTLRPTRMPEELKTLFLKYSKEK